MAGDTKEQGLNQFVKEHRKVLLYITPLVMSFLLVLILPLNIIGKDDKIMNREFREIILSNQCEGRMPSVDSLLVVLDLSTDQSEAFRNFLVSNDEIRKNDFSSIVSRVERKFPDLGIRASDFEESIVIKATNKILHFVCSYAVVLLFLVIVILAYRAEERLTESNISDFLQKYLIKHDILVGEFYKNHEIPISVDLVEKTKTEFEKLDEIEKGQYSYVLRMVKCDVSKYVELALDLLANVKRSVFSTTYFPTDDLILQLGETCVKIENNEVVNHRDFDIKSLNSSMLQRSFTKSILYWLLSVREKVNNNPEILAHRVHLFDSFDDIKNFQQAIEKAMNDNPDISLFNIPAKMKEGKEKQLKYGAFIYDTYYEKDSCCTFKSEVIPKGDDKPEYYGEYIIFDNSVMLEYSQTFKVLTVTIGPLVDVYSKSFCNEAKNSLSTN